MSSIVIEWWPAVHKDGTKSHDGEGWYYFEDDYRDEGSTGAFRSRSAAFVHAMSCCDESFEILLRAREAGEGERDE